MNNKEKLLKAIGDVDEQLIPPLTPQKKRNRILQWAAIGGACAAAVIVCLLLLPKEKQTTIPKKGETYIAKQLSSPVYPTIPPYPDGNTEDGYEAWNKARRALWDQPKGYRDGFDMFFANSTKVFLSDAEAENRVYSPLSLYMALAMSAEITDGTARQQILAALAQSDLKSLRSHAKSIWQANYMDDGMAKCVLANSIWTNNKQSYDEDTLDRLAGTYYSSVFTGDPADDAYHTLYRQWMNEQTDGLLENYVSDMKLDPETVLSLVSTVNYSGKWFSPFQKKDTAPGQFHAKDGDILCDFMHMQNSADYYAGENFRAVMLPLENNGQMRLLLPDEGIAPETLLSDEDALTFMMEPAESAGKEFALVNLSVPKFDVSSQIDLESGMKELGIHDVFDAEKADFSPLLAASDGVALSAASQSARVMIDEEGCKAAALTSMMYAGGYLPPEPVDFTLDRPFVFEIMSETGLPLFVGVVQKPIV